MNHELGNAHCASLHILCTAPRNINDVQPQPWKHYCVIVEKFWDQPLTIANGLPRTNIRREIRDKPEDKQKDYEELQSVSMQIQ